MITLSSTGPTSFDPNFFLPFPILNKRVEKYTHLIASYFITMLKTVDKFFDCFLGKMVINGLCCRSNSNTLLYPKYKHSCNMALEKLAVKWRTKMNTASRLELI